MTLAEMEYDFDLKIDKIDSQSTTSFNRIEKQWLLNEAQLVFVKKIFKQFELNQKRIDDLKTLVVINEEHVPTLDTALGVYEFKFSDLDLPYMFFISGRAKLNGCTPAKIANLKFVQLDDLNYILEDPFNNSNEKELVYNIGRSSDNISSSIYIYNNNLTVDSIFINYVKYPVKMSSGNYVYINGGVLPANNCELPEHTHNEIVDIAVQIASGIIQHPDYVQLKSAKVFENLN